MIRLTRLNKQSLILNADLIEQIQATPDTVITLTTGGKYVVLEDPEDIVDQVVSYKRRVWRTAPEVLQPVSVKGQEV